MIGATLAQHLLVSSEEWAQIMFIGLAVTAIVVTLILANAGERSEGARVVAYGLFSFVAAMGALIGLLVPAAAGSSAGRIVAGMAISLASGVLGVACLIPAVRRWIARWFHAIRPESSVHAVALGLYVLVLLQQVAAQVAVDQLKVLSEVKQSPSLFFIIGTNQLPMTIVSLFGVGFLVRRNLSQTLDRLGLYWPRWRWLAVSVAVALLLVAFGIAFDIVTARLTPEQTKSIEQVSSQLLRNVSGLPAILALGVAAGMGEEILFRGALLPRIGNLPSALLFAALHTQYAISFATLEILILGLVLGVLRKRAGTTGCIVAHAGYDIVVGLLTLVH